MTEEYAEPLPDEPAPPPRVGCTKLAWAAILLMLALLITVRYAPMWAPGEDTNAHGSRLDLKVTELQLRLLVAQKYLSKEDNRELYKTAQDMDRGDTAKRLCFVPFAGEMAGPKEALARLDDLSRDLPKEAEEPSPEERELLRILRRLYGDYERGDFRHASLTDHDAAYLADHLGWLGRLALNPPVPGVDDSDDRGEVLGEAVVSLLSLGGLCSLGGLLVLSGFLASVFFLHLWRRGKVRIGLATGSPFGGVYAETFAVWLIGYGSSLLLGPLVLPGVNPILRSAIVMPLSLLVLLWPVLRGVPWAQVRRDIGWTAGRSPLLEPFFGIASYVINLPVVLLGFGTTLLLFALSNFVLHALQGADAAPPTPTHPAAEAFAGAAGPTLALLFFLACVVAPVVEETMFRGLLHRQMRESTARWRPLLGGLTSALAVNVLFAAVHPQGLLFTPVLTAVAFAMTLAREWRGTLIPSICAHGTSNGLVLLLNVLLWS